GTGARARDGRQGAGSPACGEGSAVRAPGMAAAGPAADAGRAGQTDDGDGRERLRALLWLGAGGWALAGRQPPRPAVPIRHFGPKIHEATQLTIETIRAPRKAAQKLAIWKPGTSSATSPSIRPLTTSRNRPSVTIVIGRVRMTATGRTKALTMPSTAAATSSEMPLPKLMPPTKLSANQSPM